MSPRTVMTASAWVLGALGLVEMSEGRRFQTTGGRLQEVNKLLASRKHHAVMPEAGTRPRIFFLE